MRQRSRTAILILVLLTLLVTGASVAQARTVTVWPGSFRATDPDVPGYAISQEAIRGPGAVLVFDAPLNLPVGATLTSAVMSWQAPYWAAMQCWIVRKPFNGPKQTIASAWVYDLPAAIGWTRFPLTLTGVDPVVRKGYRYFIEVDLYHLVSSCGGFKVTYTPPAH